MLQNRVDPFGNLIKTKARGALMGNRGVLHDEHQQIRRPFKLKTWIACVLEFKGRKRKVMTPNRWTELFFLDEATSFAAGHRPCFECRRADADRFKTLWLKANPEYGFDQKISIKEIDAILDKERIRPDKSKVTFEDDAEKLPNGTFVLFDEKPWLFWDSALYLWTPFGYEPGAPLPDARKLTVLTPRSVVRTFRAGYVPQTAPIFGAYA
jgi:hypothetical protein